MLNKLRTVIYHVADLEEATTWYTHLTGVQPYFNEAFYVGFDINGCELGLDADMTGVEKGNHAVSYWSVDDIHGAVEKAVAAGAIVIHPVHNVGGPIETAVVQDPFGNQVGFITGA